MSSLLATLIAQRGDHAFTAIALGSLPCYLAVNSSGHPALVISAGRGGQVPPLETEYLALQLFVEATITELDGTIHEGKFHVLACKKGGQEVLRPFEVIALSLAESLSSPDEAALELTAAFETLRDLFRSKAADNLLRARTGLWGELFFMRESLGYLTMVNFWHTETGRKFDFSWKNCRLEIKTTSKADRSHSFAHGQLYSSGQSQILVASLVVQPEDAGLSLADIIAEARSALASEPGALLKLEKSLRVAGMSDSIERGPSFDAVHARNHLRFYWSDDVPHFPMEEPPGVSGTTYVASLSTALNVPLSLVRDWLTRWGTSS